MKTINNITDLMYAVATTNADAYCIEDETQAEELKKAIEDNGMTMLRGEARTEALAKLDLEEDSERIVYQAGSYIFSLMDDEYTYDVCFDTDTMSDRVGAKFSLKEAEDYISMNNGWSQAHGYWEDYKEGTVSVYCNETEETVSEYTVL